MRTFCIAGIVIFLAVNAQLSRAQTGIDPDSLSQTTVVRAARLLDVAAGQIVPNASVAVKGAKIVSVSTGDVPGGVKVIDLGDMTILPGLIDVHTHLVFDMQTDWALIGSASMPRTGKIQLVRSGECFGPDFRNWKDPDVPAHAQDNDFSFETPSPEQCRPFEGAAGTGATFVFGSAVPHPHELHLGSYSVHTSPEALAAGERHIRELQERMAAAGDRRTGTGSTPVFRG